MQLELCHEVIECVDGELKIIFYLGLILQLILSAFGLWWLAAGWQWVWAFMTMPCCTLVVQSLRGASQIAPYLPRICLLSVVIAVSAGFSIAAFVLSPWRIPNLHKAQYAIHATLGLLVICVFRELSDWHKRNDIEDQLSRHLQEWEENRKRPHRYGREGPTESTRDLLDPEEVIELSRLQPAHCRGPINKV